MAVALPSQISPGYFAWLSPFSIQAACNLTCTIIDSIADGSIEHRVYAVIETALLGSAALAAATSVYYVYEGKFLKAVGAGSVSVVSLAGALVTQKASQQEAHLEIIRTHERQNAEQQEIIRTQERQSREQQETHERQSAEQQELIRTQERQNAEQQEIIRTQERQSREQQETHERQSAEQQEIIENHKKETLVLNGEITRLALVINGFEQERENLKLCISALIKDTEGKLAKDLTAVEDLIKERRIQLTSLEAEIVAANAQMVLIKEQFQQCNAEHQKLIEEQREVNTAAKVNTQALQDLTATLTAAVATQNLTGFP
jgi:hypothetical protein